MPENDPPTATNPRITLKRLVKARMMARQLRELNKSTAQADQKTLYRVGIFQFIEGNPEVITEKSFKSLYACQNFIWKQLLKGNCAYLSQIKPEVEKKDENKD